MWRLLSLAVSYLWAIAISLVPLGIALYVLWRLTNRTEVLIVSLAGVLYAMIIVAWTSHDFQIRELREEVAKTRLAVRSLIDPHHKEKFIESLREERPREEKEFREVMLDLLKTLVAVVVLIACAVRFFKVL